MDFFSLILAIVSYVILYFVIKAAVRNGIIEAQGKRKGVFKMLNEVNPDEDDRDADGNSISQTTCPQCNTEHDIDYPVCPHCGHRYG